VSLHGIVRGPSLSRQTATEEAAMPSRDQASAAIEDLSRTFGGNRLTTNLTLREQHANTTTWIAPEPPDAVVFPGSAEDVREIVRICARHDVPVIPFGVGSSFEGHVNAPRGGISIDFREMNALLAVHAEDFDCVIQPGITRKSLNDQLKSHGLFFPIDPGADASLGGMASTRASGTNAVRYGTMKENVLALKAVLPDGSLINTGQRARKSSAGYDLTRLFVGAEGTLGVITELTLRLYGLPEAIASGVCAFPSVGAACGAAIATIQAGSPIARVEFLDEVMIRACNRHSRLEMAETPTLFMEFHGTEASVAEQSERFGAVAAEFTDAPFAWAVRPEERSRLWQARHDAFWAMRSFRAGAKVLVTDVCVPISRLAECVEETKRDLAESRLIAPIVGHAGDGNFHAGVCLMLDDADEVARTKAFAERLAARAIAMEGTCTGEHGIGEGKMHFLEPELGAGAVGVMAALKQALDPRNIMNPGKIVAFPGH
jgi:D-lactate dehydrogenase (cytochrome)